MVNFDCSVQSNKSGNDFVVKNDIIILVGTNSVPAVFMSKLETEIWSLRGDYFLDNTQFWISYSGEREYSSHTYFVWETWWVYLSLRTLWHWYIEKLFYEFFSLIYLEREREEHAHWSCSKLKHSVRNVTFLNATETFAKLWVWFYVWKCILVEDLP